MGQPTEEPWLTPVIVSSDRCDSITSDTEALRVVPEQLFAKPTEELQLDLQTLPVPPVAPSDDGFENADVNSSDLRLQRLRTLFGELHNRLEAPTVSEASVMAGIPECDSEVFEIVEPVPLPPDETFSVNTSPESEDSPSFPVVESVTDSASLPVDEPDSPTFTLPEQLTEGIVNRIELADTLFASGEIRLALDVYAAIDLDLEEGADRSWVIFQSAACYRRLGDATEATKRYRHLVTVTEPAWLADVSRWWLEEIEKRGGWKQRSGDIESIIKQQQESVHADIGT